MSFKSAPPSLDDDPSAGTPRPILTTCLWLSIWSAGLIGLVLYAGERLKINEDAPQANSLANWQSDSRIDAETDSSDESRADSQAAVDTDQSNESQVDSQVDAEANASNDSPADPPVETDADRTAPGENVAGGVSALPAGTEASASRASDDVIKVKASTNAQASPDSTQSARSKAEAESGNEPDTLAEAERQPEPRVRSESGPEPRAEAELKIASEAEPESKPEPEPVESSAIFIDDGEQEPKGTASGGVGSASDSAATVVAELPADISARSRLENKGSQEPVGTIDNSSAGQADDSNASKLDPAEEVITVQKKFEGLPQTRVNFYSASTEITAEGQQALDGLAQIMKEHSTVNLDIQGHTDTTGFALANLYLSQTRAGSVRDYLVDKGISLYRMLPRGFGESEPIGDNSTSAGRALNRRIEFRFLEENKWN